MSKTPKGRFARFRKVPKTQANPLDAREVYRWSVAYCKRLRAKGIDASPLANPNAVAFDASCAADPADCARTHRLFLESALETILYDDKIPEHIRARFHRDLPRPQKALETILCDDEMPDHIRARFHTVGVIITKMIDRVDSGLPAPYHHGEKPQWTDLPEDVRRLLGKIDPPVLARQINVDADGDILPLSKSDRPHLKHTLFQCDDECARCKMWGSNK